MFLPVSMAWPASVYSELAPARTVHLGNLARHSRQSVRKGRHLNNKQRDNISLTKVVKKYRYSLETYLKKLYLIIKTSFSKHLWLRAARWSTFLSVQVVHALPVSSYIQGSSLHTENKKISLYFKLNPNL
jgi:hypothetical protein